MSLLELTKTGLRQETIRFLKSGIADPHEMAVRYSATLSESDLIEFAVPGLAEKFRCHIRGLRHKKPAPRSAKWALSRVDCAWKVKGEWKFLRDYTLADMEQFVADYDNRGKQNFALRDAGIAIIAEMRARGVDRVCELPAELVDDLLPDS